MFVLNQANQLLALAFYLASSISSIVLNSNLKSKQATCTAFYCSSHIAHTLILRSLPGHYLILNYHAKINKNLYFDKLKWFFQLTKQQQAKFLRLLSLKFDTFPRVT